MFMFKNQNDGATIGLETGLLTRSLLGSSGSHGSVTIFSDFFALFLREQKMAVARASVADIRPESLAVRAAWAAWRPPPTCTLAADMTVP